MSPLLLLSLVCAPLVADHPASFELPGPGERPVAYDAHADGTLWAVGANWKASFGADGVTYIPITGSVDQVPQPVRFGLSRASSADFGLAVTAPTAVSRDGDSIELARGAVREVWHLSPYEIEQTFVIDALPTRGDLVLSVELDTLIPRRRRSEELHFEGSDGVIRYGRAIAIDASGRRVDVARVATPEGFELRVDAAFLADAALPLVVDPIISNTFTVAASTRPQRRPAAAFGMANVGSGNTSSYMVVWEELAGGSDIDLWSAEVATNGALIPGSLRLINGSTEITLRPDVAFDRPSQMWMVAYERSVSGGSPYHIHARRRELNSQLPWFIGNVVSPTNEGSCHNPSIGGYEADLTQGVHSFTIVWEKHFVSDWNIQARQMGTNGAPTSAVLNIAASPANDRFPSISKGAGQPFFGFHWHNIVWTREPQGNSSSVHARRITTVGGTLTGEVQVSAGMGGFGAVACETQSEPVMNDGSLPFNVIYDQRFANGSFKYARLVGNSQFAGGTNIDYYENLEHLTDALEYRTGHLGEGIAYAYTVSEGGSLALRIGTGENSYRASNGSHGFGLGERDVRVANLLDSEDGFTLATHSEGGGHQDQAALIWSSQGVLRGAIYDGPGTPLSPILGVQECISVANSTGERGWIAGFGSGDVIANKTIVASDLPANSFGYLLVAPQSGTSMPANSIGRLCLNGQIGRYLGQVQQTSADGTMSFLVRPYDLPTPNGSVAAQPGQNWFFQVWHRDFMGGTATSNFTNALQVTFE